MPYCTDNNIEIARGKTIQMLVMERNFTLRSMDDKILSYIDFYNYKFMYSGVRYRTPSENVAKALNIVWGKGL